MDVHQFTYLFVIGLILAFLDAFGIGANDVANSFATSVGSRSISLKQACIIAVFTEFGGAILMGASTTDTIKNGIIDVKNFKGNPELLMLGFVCALAGSATWVLTASRFGWPVSTTHSIVGAICGVGIAGFGGNAVIWGWEGMGKIIASWFISPIVAGTVASIIFLITKFGIMRSPNSLNRGLNSIPIYFGITITICVLYVVLKGGKAININSDNVGVVLGATFGAGAVVALFCFFFVRVWLRRKLVNEEKLVWYQVFYVPFLGPQPRDEHISDRLNRTYGDHTIPVKSDVEAAQVGIAKEEEVAIVDHDPIVTAHPSLVNLDKETSTGKAWNKVKGALTKGINMDVAQVQSSHVKEVHSHAVKYDSKTEYLYSFLQVITASFASFAHGSNDVANAVGPLAAIYGIWSTAQLPGKKADVPIWILAFGGIAIDIGLTLYGYNVMKNLGNNITYHSPSRGFSMELGAALTVITASFIGLPVSTTHCITGATAMVGLCSGSWRALNWKVLGWCMFSWILTVPVAGLISGCLFALIANAPKFL
ncbi:hypothetical protein SpCBS45565_g00849 [Spizellomyces sp. 'palustris']|nr:hypothetical protein SpCBS45565_g00849 [Spizellomyces sp. 'palustris']